MSVQLRKEKKVHRVRLRKWPGAEKKETCPSGYQQSADEEKREGKRLLPGGEKSGQMPT